MTSCAQKKKGNLNDSLEHKGLFVMLDGLWTVYLPARVMAAV